MVFSSPHGVISILEGKTAWNWVEDHATNIPNKPAYICGITERTLTFADVHDQARKICAALAAEGIKNGDIVTLHSFNCIEYPVIFLALTRLGAVCSTASPLFNEEELADQLKHSESVALITNAEMVDTAVKAASLSNIELNRRYADEGYSVPEFTSGGPGSYRGYAFFKRHYCSSEGGSAIGSSTVCWCYDGEQLGEGHGVHDDCAAVLPHHVHAAVFYRGWATIVLPKLMPDEYLSALVKYKVWNVYVAPPIVQFFAKHPIIDKYDLSCLKYIGSGGAPMGTEAEDAVFKRIGAEVGQGYGMTELCGPVTMPAYELNRPGSVGQLLPNSQLRVQSLSNGDDLGPNEVGELFIRTPANKNPEETKKAITEDHFCHTGDVGYIDEDGFIFIVDRVKGMIKYKGHQVAPAELEDVLHGHTDVVGSCCVRGKDLVTGEEVPKAYVVLREGASCSPEDIMKFVGDKVAPYKRVRQIELVDSIPKTMSGKILRRQLQIEEDKKIKAATAP